MTTDEYFEQSEALILLELNLKLNIEMMADILNNDSRESLLRMNKIVIRQCMQAHGINFPDGRQR